MASLTPTPILGGYNRTTGSLRVTELTSAALVSLALPQGDKDAAQKAIKKAYGLELPAPGLSTASKTHRLIRMSPDQAMLLFDDDSPLAEPAVQSALAGACYTTNQTDAWVIIDVDGETVRTVLQRLCPLDLHPDTFAIDTAVRTVMEHMGAMIIRVGDNRFVLMSASSSAASFIHAIETSVAYTA